MADEDEEEMSALFDVHRPGSLFDTRAFGS